MKISLTSISIGDRVNAAQTQTTNRTDTSSVPSSINPSPGDSTISPVDTSGIDRAGSDINKQAQQGNKATSDSARKQNNTANQGLQYDKQTLSADDQSPATTRAIDIEATPQPKSKGFKDSLIGAQMANSMGNKTGGDHGAPDRDFGHNNGNPNEHVHNQPESEPIRRSQTTQYDPSNARVPEPQSPPITEWNTTNNQPAYKPPVQDLGPAYIQRDPSAPKVRFNMPKIGTPKFK